MAFVVQCPFCRFRAKAPDRAVGAMGRCPNCASSFTFAPVDDRHLPESGQAQPGDESAAEPVPEKALGAAIAEAVAAVSAPPPVEPPAESLRTATSKRSNRARVAGALAIFLSGLALAAGAVAFLYPFVRVLGALALLAGLAGIVLGARAARRRLFLPLMGTASAFAVLIVAWFFPALLGPAYEFSRRRPEPTPVGLHALPLGGAPALAEVPPWTDARRYALGRDALRVQVIRCGLLPPAKAMDKDQPPPKERFVVSVRVSSQARDADSIERDARFAPTLTDDTGKSYPLLQTEFLGKMPGLYAVPTIEENFVFAAPANGWKTLRLELPAARWQGTGAFRFVIHAPGPDPQR